MTEEVNNINIQVEQICAAILQTIGSLEVSLETLISNYSNKSISVSQNEDTKALTFSLVDNEVAQAENE